MNIGATTIRALLMETEVGERQPTVRQVRAVENLVENGGKNKGLAIREAGYSEAMVKNPDRVFGSPTVRKVLEKLGVVDETEPVKALRENLKAKTPVNFVFPPFREPEECLTDQQIRDYLNEGGITISKIVHSDASRRVYGYADNPNAQLRAADMILKIFGAYAPKTVSSKNVHAVGIMSMHELRESMREAGVSVLQKEPIK